MIFKLICGLAGLAYSTWLFIIRYKKHKTIDTKSTAEVKEVRKLGMGEGSKQYPIFYKVLAEPTFEICKTPVRKRESTGKRKIICYESKEPAQNYYFPKFKNFDHRLVFPIVMALTSLIVIVYTIISLF